MKRREFISLLGGAAAAWPVAARAQQTGKLPTIGYLGPGGRDADRQRVDAFINRLRELGWIEGRNVAIEQRWADNHAERFFEIADSLVQRKVDVIVTMGSVVPAVKRATSTIPIIFAIDGDPVGRGLVASLARPGGNVTGLSIQVPELAGKRLGLLREVVPGIRRLAVMANVGAPNAVLEMGEAHAVARTLGLEVAGFEIRRAEDIASSFDALKGRADALYVCGDALVVTNRTRINTFALGARLPTMHFSRDLVEAGGLMSYGANFPDMWRRTADF